VILGGGASFVEADFTQTSTSVTRTGATAFTVGDFEAQSAWRAGFGYRFSRTWALETAYWDFGKPRYQVSVTAPVSTSYERTLRVRGITLDLAYRHAISESLAGLVRVGGLWSRVEAGAVRPAGLTALDEEVGRSKDWHVGLGVSYRISPRVDLRVDYDFFRKVGDKDRFGTANLQTFLIGVGFEL
jgi:opacity protein-like surface antigen